MHGEWDWNAPSKSTRPMGMDAVSHRECPGSRSQLPAPHVQTSSAGIGTSVTRHAGRARAALASGVPRQPVYALANGAVFDGRRVYDMELTPSAVQQAVARARRKLMAFGTRPAVRSPRTTSPSRSCADGRPGLAAGRSPGRRAQLWLQTIVFCGTPPGGDVQRGAVRERESRGPLRATAPGCATSSRERLFHFMTGICPSVEHQLSPPFPARYAQIAPRVREVPSATAWPQQGRLGRSTSRPSIRSCASRP